MRLVEMILERGALEKDALALACGLTAAAGTFGAYLSRARTVGLLEIEGGIVRVSEALFP